MSVIHDMTKTFPQTSLWNDSADPVQLTQAIGWGAVGATCNPVIALTAMKADPETWKARIRAIATENPSASESQIGWQAIEELSVSSAKLLMPAFAASKGKDGRMSMQVDPRHYRNPEAMTAQAVHFHNLAPNVVVKIPAIATGLIAIEEATAQGVSINATVSFTTAQAIAVAEAVERGLDRAAANGIDIATMGPVCTIMGGRLDDWIKIVAKQNNLLLPPGDLEWPGVIAIKEAYRLYKERGYRTRMLSAAFRNQLLMTEFAGGDLVISPPFDWQVWINQNEIALPSRIDVPVDPAIVQRLQNAMPDVVAATTENGLKPDEFLTYGATLRTLRGFLQSTAHIEEFVRDVLTPAPKE